MDLNGFELKIPMRALKSSEVTVENESAVLIISWDGEHVKLDSEPKEGIDADLLESLRQKVQNGPRSLVKTIHSVLGEGSFYSDLYTEENFLGFGGFGSAYKCVNKVDNQTYAIKIIPFGDGDEDYDMARSECVVMASLKHDNIVRYYQSWVEDIVPSFEKDFEDVLDAEEVTPTRTLYIAMEWCVETLHSRFSRDITTPEVDRIFENIMAGLAYLGVKRVIHCDVTPKNLFLDAQGVCKIGDFGSAYMLGDEESFLVQLDRPGDTQYFAPEVEDFSRYSAASDIYSAALSMMDVIYPSGTDMERKKFFKKLENREFPERDPRLSAVTYDCLMEIFTPSADDRPSAQDLIANY